MPYHLLVLENDAYTPRELAASYSGTGRTDCVSISWGTAIESRSFAAHESTPLTQRDTLFLSDLLEAAGTRPFMRRVQCASGASGYLDAGNVRRLAERGYLRHVSGRLDSPDCLFQLTERVFVENLSASDIAA